MKAKVNPELLQQLDQAGTRPVQAIVQLRPSGKADAGISPEETDRLAKHVLQRVAEAVGSAASRVNVLRNLGTAIVEADADFIRSLIEQPEVIAAMPNQTAESPFIPPKKKRPV